MIQAVVIYTTFPNKAQALGVGKIVVQERLAACITLLPQATSIYEWEGKLEDAEEVVMLVKTTQSQTEHVIARLQSLHPYSCPCILALPVEKGNLAFWEWVKERVGE